MSSNQRNHPLGQVVSDMAFALIYLQASPSFGRTLKVPVFAEYLQMAV
jgi:hypothetical protein